MPIVLFVKYLLFLPQYMLVIVKKNWKIFSDPLFVAQWIHFSSFETACWTPSESATKEMNIASWR